MSYSQTMMRVNRGEVVVPFLMKWVAQFIKEHGKHELDKRLLEAQYKFIKEDFEFSDGTIDEDYYSDWFHLSSALDCARRSWFKRLRFPGKAKQIDDTMKEWLIFSNGDAGHLRWQCLLHVAGVLIGRESTAKFVSQEHRVRGKSDGILLLPNEKKRKRLFEFKTCNSRMFAQVKKAMMPYDSHVVQANGYMHYLELPVASIIYENKDTHEVIEFNVTYSKKLFEWTLKNRILPQKDAIRAIEMPDREGKSINAPPCKWCEFIETCFNPYIQEENIEKIKASRAAKKGKPKRFFKKLTIRRGGKSI